MFIHEIIRYCTFLGTIARKTLAYDLDHITILIDYQLVWMSCLQFWCRLEQYPMANIKPDVGVCTNSRWSTLSFLLSSHHKVFIFAVTFSAIAAVVGPITSILLGKFMNPLAQMIKGQLNGDEFWKESISLARILCIVGAADGLIGTLFLFSWIEYGEVQTRRIRFLFFQSMLTKSLSWFDDRENGVGAFLSRSST